METASTEPAVPPKRRPLLFYGCLIALALLLVILATAALTAWWVSRQLNARPFEPVQLSPGEQAALQEKAAVFGDTVPPIASVVVPPPPPETEERRSVTLTERELNGLLAHNTGLAERVYLDLERDAIRARVNVPLEPDFPVLGGRTIRATLALGVQLVGGRVEVWIRDLSLGGFPLPNAWLGGIKHVDLVEMYFADDPAMQAFVDGIESLRIDSGGITLTPAP
jgi:hypothetical protein